MRAEPKSKVAVGCSVQHDLVGALEFVLVVVGGQPADDDAVVFSQALAVHFDVFGERAAQGLVDREIAQELVGGGAIELRVVDELSSWFWVSAQVF